MDKQDLLLPTRADLIHILRVAPMTVYEALGVGLVPMAVPVDGPVRLHVWVKPGQAQSVPVHIEVLVPATEPGEPPAGYLILVEAIEEDADFVPHIG